MPEQVHISITCDKEFVADSLRELANAIENRETVSLFETYHCRAEID